MCIRNTVCVCDSGLIHVFLPPPRFSGVHATSSPLRTMLQQPWLSVASQCMPGRERRMMSTCGVLIRPSSGLTEHHST